MKNAGCILVPSFSDISSQSLALWHDFDAWLVKHSKNTEYAFRYRGPMLIMLHKGVQLPLLA